MACEVADGLRLGSTDFGVRANVPFQWPVKWPMVCAWMTPSSLTETANGVSMACEVADGLRPAVRDCAFR